MRRANLKVLLFLSAFIFCALNSFAQTWNATWMKDNNNTLKITNENVKSFHFEIVSNGVKDIDGEAIINGTSATYTKNKSELHFDLAIDSSFVQTWYIDKKGKTIREVYKMSNEDFFIRLNKQVGAEPSSNPEASKNNLSVNKSNTSNTIIEQAFEDYWLEFSTALGNNAKGNVIKEDVIKMTLFPFELNQDGSVVKFDKKRFNKEFDNLFAPGSELFLKEANEFKIVADNSSFLSLGINKNDKIYYTIIEKDNLPWMSYTYYFAKVKNKYKLIYLVQG